MSEIKDPFLRYSRYFQWLADVLYNPDKYFVFTPWGQRIGHIAMETIMAVCIAIRDKKKLIFIFPIKSVNNEISKCDFNCTIFNEKDVRFWVLKSLLFFSGAFHYLYNGILSKLIIAFPLLSKAIPPFFFYPRYGLEEGKWGGHRLRGSDFYLDGELILSNDWQVHLSSDQLIKGDILRKKMGIPDKAWFVCLHVREKGFLGASIRDAAISNYLLTIKYITQKGGYVVRMGDNTMEPLQPMKNVIDYALSNYRSELMDLYLIAKCRFLLGCDSGVLCLAWLLKKPSCLVNITEHSITPLFSPPNLLIQKHFFSKQKQRFLSIKEKITAMELSSNKDYISVENSPEEILETVKEYFCFLEEGKFYDSDHLQNEFCNYKRKHQEYLLKQDFIGNKEKDILSGTLSAQGRLGSFYIERCWENTSYLQELTKLYSGES
tara:strand:+ start:5248 stop:6549 length:1302 start_codon:yes stop_codon:yes gene_type:complete